MSKGDRIKALRMEKNLTQAALAKLLNTKRQTVSKYENGIVTNIPSDKIEEMSRILDTTPEYILGWDVMAEEKQKNRDAAIDISDRLLSDNVFFSVVESLYRLTPAQLERARRLLEPFLEEAFDEI